MKKTVAFSKHAVNVFFHILTRCNLSCSHCYINPAQHGKNTLPIHTIRDWLGYFSRQYKTANVIFLGGEPTLHPDLPLAVKAAKELNYRSITIDTNGYLFNDILNKVTPDEVDFVSFSLDGASRQTNDALRGQGSYDACIAGIHKAVNKGFETSLIYTVSQRNVHELKQMPELLLDLGVRRFFIQVIGIRGKSTQENTRDNFQVSRSVWMDTIPVVAATAARSGITTTYPKVFLSSHESFECAGTAAENYFIFPNGRVYRCPLCEDYPIHSQVFIGGNLVPTDKLNESDLFSLNIPEGCVMNKIIQPGNLSYLPDGNPSYKIACCMLKEEMTP